MLSWSHSPGIIHPQASLCIGGTRAGTHVKLPALLLESHNLRGALGHEAARYENRTLCSRVIIIFIQCSVDLDKVAGTLAVSSLHPPLVKLIYTKMIKNLIYFTTHQ